MDSTNNTTNTTSYSTLYQSEQESACKFCTVHKPLVFLFGITSVVYLAAVIYCYQADIWAYLTGGSPVEGSVEALLAPRASILQQQPPPPPLPPPPAPAPAQPPPPQTIIVASGPPQVVPQVASPAQPAPKVSPNSPKSPLPASAEPIIKKIAPGVGQANKQDAITPYESTGSTYFKQVMKGKKAVASISQYVMKKDKDKKGGKHHHGHHHKHKRNKKDKQAKDKETDKNNPDKNLI